MRGLQVVRRIPYTSANVVGAEKSGPEQRAMRRETELETEMVKSNKAEFGHAGSAGRPRLMRGPHPISLRGGAVVTNCILRTRIIGKQSKVENALYERHANRGITYVQHS